MIVENLPLPFGRRSWLEVTTLTRAGYHVSVICPKGKGYDESYEVIDGVHIYRHSLPPEQSSSLGYIREYLVALAWEWRLALRVFREQGVDIIHICNPPDLLFLVAGWFKLFRGTRVIFDHHDINPELYVAKYGRRGLFYQLLRIAERLTFATADAVISTNESYREIALTRGRKHPDDVFVVLSSPDMTSFHRLPALPSLHRGRRYLVGYVGIIAEQDGLDHLIEAIRHVVQTFGRSDVHFLVIGEGPSLEDIRTLAHRSGIEDYVTFTGYLRGDELLQHLSSCDLGVVPDPKDPYTDRCTTNKILEYMALGLAMVQYDLTEGRISAGPASLYATPNDSEDLARNILTLLDDEELRNEMGAAGRQRLETVLEWRHQIPALLAAYERAQS